MTARRTVPGADELFPADGGRPASVAAEAPSNVPDTAGSRRRLASVADPTRRPAAAKDASGRPRHDERITVYVSGEELLALEQARLTLRAEHGLAVDRGRIVREAVALALAELESEHDRSALVRRLLAR